MSDYIITRSGARFYPLDPDPEAIHIDDIASALSKKCRFTGHCAKFYSVAEHSVVTAHFARLLDPNGRSNLQALLHDAAEAYLADVATPVKRDPRFAFFREAEEALSKVIYQRFGVVPTDQTNAVVKRADEEAFRIEWRELMHSETVALGGTSVLAPAPPALDDGRGSTRPSVLLCAAPPYAERLFMEVFRLLRTAKRIDEGLGR